MNGLPRQIDKRIRRELENFPLTWTLEKKRDHYFVLIDGHPPVCIGSNSSRERDGNIRYTLRNLKRIREDYHDAHHD